MVVLAAGTRVENEVTWPSPQPASEQSRAIYLEDGAGGSGGVLFLIQGPPLTLDTSGGPRGLQSQGSGF